MLFKYKGLDKERKPIVGFIDMPTRKSAMITLKKDNGLTAIYQLNRVYLTDPRLNKIRETLSESQTKSAQKSIERKEKTEELKNKLKNLTFTKQTSDSLPINTRVKIASSRLKNRVVSFIKPRKAIELQTNDYEKMYNLIKGQITSENAYENSISNIDYIELDIKQPEIKQKVEKKQTRGERTLDWDLFDNTVVDKTNNKLKVKEKEILMFTRKLSTMLASGVPIVRALTILKDGETGDLVKIIDGIINTIQDGGTFSTAIAKYPKQFDYMYVALVSIGETSGDFAKVLLQIAEFKERTSEIKAKIKTSSIYPLLLLSVITLMLIAGSIFFIPMFEELLSDSGMPLPAVTKAVFGIAKIIPYIAGISFATFVALKLLRTRILEVDRFIKSRTDWIKIKFPAIKRIVHISYMYTFSSTLTLMLGNGIRLVDSLSLTFRTSDNIYISNEVKQTRDMIVQGLSFAEALRSQTYFDNMLINLVMTGEESGKLAKVLDDAAKFYDIELNKTIENTMELVQPVSILLISAIVVPVVIAIYLPIFGISSGGM